MKIYTAHPITGLTPEQVFSYFGDMKDQLTFMGFDVLQPMTAKGYFRTDKPEQFEPGGYTNPVSRDGAIFNRDMWMVDNCDVAYFDFSGATKVSIGMVVELSRACARGKHIVTVMEKDNVHRHAFLTFPSHIIFETQDDALDYLSKLPTQEF